MGVLTTVAWCHWVSLGVIVCKETPNDLVNGGKFHDAFLQKPECLGSICPGKLIECKQPV